MNISQTQVKVLNRLSPLLRHMPDLISWASGLDVSVCVCVSMCAYAVEFKETQASGTF